ncbi:MAG TPA: ABC transporter permease, partial [Chthonomonadales bacterium]|nr:ABC transporter permease [Chthonomonadales bacterium]
KQTAQLAVVSAGSTRVIASGGIDISVGSVLGLCSMVAAYLCVRAGWPLPAACAGAIVCGGLCGLINGALISRLRLAPIIVTLAMFAAARAAAELLNAGNSISGIPASLTENLAGSDLLGIPVLFWIGLATLVAAGVLLKTTALGRSLLAIGGNRTAAQLSGVPVESVEMLVYTLNGALAGLAGVINVAQAATGAPTAGLYMELQAITAVVLGGSDITGGRATMAGAGLGVLTINVLISGGRLLGHEDQAARFLVGAALLAAVEAQNWRRRKSG